MQNVQTYQLYYNTMLNNRLSSRIIARGMVGRRGMADVQPHSVGGMSMGMFSAPRKERKEGDVSSACFQENRER